MEPPVIIRTEYEGIPASSGWSSGAYRRIVQAIVPLLEAAGKNVQLVPFSAVGIKSFDVCTGFALEHGGVRAVYLHQENDRFPRDWHEALRGFDVVLSPSPHMTQVMRESDSDLTVVDMPLSCVDDAVYRDDFTTASFDAVLPGRFKFLMVGAAQPRKNTDGLIEVFLDTFANNDDVVLLLKSGGYGEDGEAARKIGSASNVQLITHELSDGEMRNLYRSVAEEGAYVHPHRAECVGMPILEALASGCTTAVTDWGGPHFLPPSASLTKLRYELSDSGFMNLPGSSLYAPDETPKWAEVDSGALAEWMQQVVQQLPSQDVRYGFARQIQQRFSYRTAAARLIAWLDSNAG